MSGNRKFFVGGNWKMNGDKKSIDGIAEFMNAGNLDGSVGEWISLLIQSLPSRTSLLLDLNLNFNLEFLK